MTIGVEWFDPRSADDADDDAPRELTASERFVGKVPCALPWPPDLFKDEPEP